MQKGVNAMRELYSLEHKILPGFIFPDEEGRSINLFMLGNRFSEVCLDYIRYARGIKDKNADTGYSAESFVAEPVVIKDNGKPVYYITRFRFPFIEDISFSTLCPRAYLVHGLQGEDPRYYTIEYGQTGFREPGSYWLCGWRPSRSGSLVHANMGTIDPDEEGEIRKLMDMNNENYGVE
jgi:hypothetical protein